MAARPLTEGSKTQFPDNVRDSERDARRAELDNVAGGFERALIEDEYHIGIAVPVTNAVVRQGKKRGASQDEMTGIVTGALAMHKALSTQAPASSPDVALTKDELLALHASVMGDHFEPETMNSALNKLAPLYEASFSEDDDER